VTSNAGNRISRKVHLANVLPQVAGVCSIGQINHAETFQEGY
jgi:hypothetical protein